jgi:antitoxin FitA
MSSLVANNMDERIVIALKARDVHHGRSAEAEHCAILEEVLLKPRGRSLADALAKIPGVGRDKDFERI